MYYIECDIDKSDCFAELVDIQREIYTFFEERKDDEWYGSFEGHIEIIAGDRRLRVFYDNGLISNEVWANDVISDDYNVLWNAFPKNDEISLVIFLTDYSDKIALGITQKHAERNIVVSPQFGE